MQAEPCGNLEINDDVAKSLGLDFTSSAQRKLLSASLFNKPVSLPEAALVALGIPMVTMSRPVEYVSCQPEELRMRTVKGGRKPSADKRCNVHHYMNRPESMKHMTFCAFFDKYKVMRKSEYKGSEGVSMKDGSWVAVPRPEKQVVRYSSYDPVRQPDAFWYTVLMRHYPFTDEAKLKPTPTSSYHTLLFPGGVIDENKATQYVSDYATRNLTDEDDMSALLESVLSHLQENTEELGSSMCSSQSSPEEKCRHKLTQQDVLQEFSHYQVPPSMNQDQACFWNKINSGQSGCYVLMGGPGTGKTYLTKHLTHHFRSSGRTVMLSASTGAAAVRLSKHATTTHKAFKLGGPTTFCLSSLKPWDEEAMIIRLSDVIVIDEISMLTNEVLSNVLFRLISICEFESIHHLLTSKTVLLVGDLAQVRSIVIHHCTSRLTLNACMTGDLMCRFVQNRDFILQTPVFKYLNT